MLVRRFISAVIHNQKRKILTASQASKVLSQTSLFKSSNVNTYLSSRFAIRSILSRILLRAFSLHRLGSQSVISATNKINRTLHYSAGMSAEDSCQLATDTRELEQQSLEETNSGGSEESSTGSGLEEYEDHKSGKTLSSLREAYAKACKQKDSIWLDFADKSCYIYLYKGGGQPDDSMAAFDLDGTLIKPKSNKRIPRSATDWDLFSVWTKTKLQQCLRDCPARFVIFTNQNGIGLEIVPLDEVQQRIELVTKRLDIPCTVFMATERDVFRKPCLGMFKLFMESFNEARTLDMTKSFYCGDAIGYPSHSDADIKFAQQLGLPFLTPEKFLRGVKPKLVS